MMIDGMMMMMINGMLMMVKKWYDDDDGIHTKSVFIPSPMYHNL